MGYFSESPSATSNYWELHWICSREQKQFLQEKICQILEIVSCQAKLNNESFVLGLTQLLSWNLARRVEAFVLTQTVNPSRLVETNFEFGSDDCFTYHRLSLSLVDVTDLKSGVLDMSLRLSLNSRSGILVETFEESNFVVYSPINLLEYQAKYSDKSLYRLIPSRFWALNPGGKKKEAIHA